MLLPVGLIEALVEAIGESDTEMAGHRMTRTTVVTEPLDETIIVETTLDWPDTGAIGMDGVKYYYTGKTDTTFTGISHIAAGSPVAGAVIKHRISTTVVDASKNRSYLDKLRRAMLVDYAEAEDLDVVGRNLGVNRLPLFSSDANFRAVIKAVAYNPRGTVYGLELALTALVGAGNFEVYEDLMTDPNKVTIKLDIDAITDEASAGRAFMTDAEWDGLAGSQDGLVVSAAPLTVEGVILYELDELFDFRNDKPSALTYAYFPGDTPASAFTYAGTDAEGTYVVVTAGEYVEFTSNGGTVFYRMLDTQGARITEKSVVEVSVLLNVPEDTYLNANELDQASIMIYDGDFRVSCGIDTEDTDLFHIGLYNTQAAGYLGAGKMLSVDTYYEVMVRKVGDQYVELYVDGAFIERYDYIDFSASTSNHRIEFGLQGTPIANLAVRYKQLGVRIKTVTDYWSARGTAGIVATGNPDEFDDNITLLASGDVGKYLTIKGSGITNGDGGNNNGHWLIDSYTSPGVVDLLGPVLVEEAAVIAPIATNGVIQIDDSRGFVFPDDLGKKITLANSELSNDGTYTIKKLFEFRSPSTYKDLAADFDTAGQLTMRTNICEVDATLEVESNLDYNLEPVFSTESSLEWELSDASSISGTAITLRQGLWVNTLIMEMRLADVLSAQLMRLNELINEVIDEGPPVLYEVYPFYLFDPLGLISAYVDTLTAAGVIPAFEPL